MSDLVKSQSESNPVTHPIAATRRPAVQTSTTHMKTTNINSVPLRLALAAGLAFTPFLLGGCTKDSIADSFIDPSVTGRWEYTPTIVPVLDRIATIEGGQADIIEFADPMPEDLLPESAVYRINVGDAIEATIYDMIVTDRAELYREVVDNRGNIDIPQLGSFRVVGRTIDQVTEEVKERMRGFVGPRPLAQLTILNKRGETYSIGGYAERAGTYSIPVPNYHLLEAITSGGRIEANSEFVYVVRRVTLTDVGTPYEDLGSTPQNMGSTRSGAPTQPTTPAAPTKTGDDLLNIINDITGPDSTSPENKPPSSPGVLSTGMPSATYRSNQPDVVPATQNNSATGVNATSDQPEPVVDLDDSTLSPDNRKPANTSSLTPAAAAAGGGPGSWVFLNGKWVQATLTDTGSTATQPDGTPAPKKYIAQRTIRIRVKDLLSGNEKYNIVIRPGDVILIPAPNVGLVYMAGQINNPGAIALPPNGGLTLLRAIDSAGGMSSIAIPERIDLTRMIGTERQATIRLNGRAIAEQTQPDVYLKANDRINIGTNFWALPLAVVRNGFRVSYGFGFLIDRNFGNDVFGAPPDNRFPSQ